MSFTFKSQILRDNDTRLILSPRSVSSPPVPTWSTVSCKQTSDDELGRLALQRKVGELRRELEDLESKLAAIAAYRQSTPEQPYLRWVGAHDMRMKLPVVWNRNRNYEESTATLTRTHSSKSSLYDSTLRGDSLHRASSPGKSSSALSPDPSSTQLNTPPCPPKMTAHPRLPRYSESSSSIETLEPPDKSRRSFESLLNNMSRVRKSVEDCLHKSFGATTIEPYKGSGSSGKDTSTKEADAGMEDTRSHVATMGSDGERTHQSILSTDGDDSHQPEASCSPRRVWSVRRTIYYRGPPRVRGGKK